MDAELRPTVASDVVLPVRVVELKHLRASGGGGFCVKCEAIDELVMTKAFGLPGASREDPGPSTEADGMAVAERLVGPRCEPLILAGTAITGPDGTELRPAFHFAAKNPNSYSVPWRFLRLADKLTIVETILELSGFGGAADASFLRQHERGEAGGVGAMAPGESDEHGAELPDGQAASPTSRAGVQPDGLAGT